MIRFFTKGDRVVGSSRMRVYFVCDRLEEYGVDSTAHYVRPIPWWEVSIRRLRQLRENLTALWGAYKSDEIIYLHRTTHQWDFLIALLFFYIFLGKKWIFDFDDAIFLKSTFKVWLLTTLAEKVVIGSHFLKKYADEHNSCTMIIPTSLDIDVYRPVQKKSPNDEKFVIGWSGSAPHYQNLSFLREVFQSTRLPQNIEVDFVILGPDDDPANFSELFKDIENINFTFIDGINWKDSREIVSLIQDFDIGVMPLQETEWNKGKCAFKAIEYMACGVPALVSNVGENRYLIENQKNGFIVNNNVQEWSKTLTSVFEEKYELNQVGKRARKTIEDRYSYCANIPKLKSFLQQ